LAKMGSKQGKPTADILFIFVLCGLHGSELVEQSHSTSIYLYSICG